eukprot:gene52854-14453_t
MAAAVFAQMNTALSTAQGKAAAKKVDEFGDTGAKYVIDLKAGK